MTNLPRLAGRALRHIGSFFWNSLGQMALQAQSDTDEPPSTGTPTPPGNED